MASPYSPRLIEQVGLELQRADQPHAVAGGAGQLDGLARGGHGADVVARLVLAPGHDGQGARQRVRRADVAGQRDGVEEVLHAEVHLAHHVVHLAGPEVGTGPHAGCLHLVRDAQRLVKGGQGAGRVALHGVRGSEEDLGPAEGGDVPGRPRQLGAGLQRRRAGGPVELGEGQLTEGQEGAGPAPGLGIGTGREGPLAPAPAFGQVSPQPGIEAEVASQADGVVRRVGQRRRHREAQVGQLELEPVVPCGTLRVHVVRFGT